jgi:hypothetical protein
MATAINIVDREQAIHQAKSLFKDRENSNIDHSISLINNQPYVLRYSTQRSLQEDPTVSYARLALIDPTVNYPEIGQYQDALQTPVSSNEIALRDFTLDHYPKDKIGKIYSGLHVRKEVTNQGIGGLMIGLSNQIIEDMILRFLTNSSIEQVRAFILAASHSNGTQFNRVGWTEYQALKLGYQQVGDKEVKEMRRDFDVDKIISDHLRTSPTLSTLHPHHPI